MRSTMGLAAVTAAFVAMQGAAAAPAAAGGWYDREVVIHATPCCCCAPTFGYYKTSQYWPVYRARWRSPYYRLESYRMIRPRR
jgi:hypothetical protein